MRLIPKTVATLVSQNSDVQRVRDGITSSLQPALNFLNQYFAPMTDGSLQITKPTVIQNNTTINGNLTINGNTVMGPGSAGSVNFNIIGCNGLSCNGNVNAAGFVSPTGFKNNIEMGSYGNSSAAASPTTYQTQKYNSNGNQNRLVQMPFAGSVVGISAQYQGSTSQSSINVQVNKNNSSLWPMTQVTSGGSGAYGSLNAAKGQYSFVKGDFLTTICSFGTAGSVSLQVDIFVEMAA